MNSSLLSPCGPALLAAALACSALAQAPPAAPAAPALNLQDKPTLDDPKVELDPIPSAIPRGPAPSSLPGAPPAPLATPAETASPPVQMLAGLEKLTPQQRLTASQGVAEVAGFMRGVRLQESLAKLNEVEQITGEFHIVSNMRGAVFTKMRDFPAARTQFEKAIQLTKGQPRENFHPTFNLAEINFVEKKWAAARTSFTELLTRNSVPDVGTRRIMEFKVLVCFLQEKNTAAAQTQAEKFDQYDNDSPAFYFAQASFAFAKDNKEEAEEWIASASKIYPSDLNNVYQDSLIEVGWLQSLQ